MQSTAPFFPFTWLPSWIAQGTYQTFQQGKAALSLLHKSLVYRLRDQLFPALQPPIALPTSVLNYFHHALDQLLALDWQEAEAGVYPVDLLFDTPWLDILYAYPLFWLDVPQTWQRRQEGKIREFDPAIDRSQYPNYYLQNFHYQTDGYLSDRSADLYDLQVELLFNGGADPMRRRVLKPLKDGLANLPITEQSYRILDVACGTGRTLKLLRSTFPHAALSGMDLSTPYLNKAQSLLADCAVNLQQSCAEHLPYDDRSFEGITCVFLFHELPPTVRQAVLAECYRVLVPGGTLVICDSIQELDFPELKPLMENFTLLFHEPYYLNYVRDNLTDRLAEVGFIVQSTNNHFMSKYWVAQRPQ